MVDWSSPRPLSSSGISFLSRIETIEVPGWEFERVQMIQVTFSIAGHDHVHLRSTNQERIEVAPVDLI